MAAQWPRSRNHELDVNRDPIIGARAYFYNVGTTTPQTVYSDPNLGESHDQPVETDSYGRWPAVYFNPDPGEYRQYVTDDTGALLYDDDGVDVPLAADYTPPEAGDTSVTLLYQTGDIKYRYGTGALTGYVRANGRTIGSALSGASERANADTEDLFEFLWNADPNLTVSSGRGANAAADFAANKTISLPDMRGRVLAGLDDMGTSAASVLTGLTTLGETAGDEEHTLLTTEIPSHAHAATFTGEALPGHTHSTALVGSFGTDQKVLRGDGANTGSFTTGSTSAGTPAGTVAVDNTGGGQAHSIVQPTMGVTVYIKL